ncbi:unnamed protein product [Prorocentrum cordatum]|uniref:Uncharacterized protein n=1 Tax=Prorocentrum cordatum TaxID=2364126 RepID=A0ABN9T7X2_9DINO|nr:unnamed protein product [Polarella glacialis]
MGCRRSASAQPPTSDARLWLAPPLPQQPPLAGPGPRGPGARGRRAAWAPPPATEPTRRIRRPPGLASLALREAAARAARARPALRAQLGVVRRREAPPSTPRESTPTPELAADRERGPLAEDSATTPCEEGSATTARADGQGPSQGSGAAADVPPPLRRVSGGALFDGDLQAGCRN